MQHITQRPATESGTFTIGGDLTVYRLGFGTMRQSEQMTVAESEAMIDLCERLGIGFIHWSPLAFGELARSGGALDQIARRHNARPGQVALAWLLKRSSAMLPIPGTSRVKHLDEDMVGATIKLSQEEFDALDRRSKQL